MELDDTEAPSSRGVTRDDVTEPSSDEVGDHLASVGERFEPNLSLAHRKASVAAALFGEAPPSVKIGRFTIVRKLGSGGMGVVYVAYDEQLDRRVAVKLLRNNVASPDARVRFVREGQAMARLSHSNVVTVYDVGVHDDQLFVAMEFVDGQDLRAWIQAEPRDWRTVVEVFRQAGEGLAAAHEAGIVHRDFKPDNVLVGHDRRVCVADFGLAHQFDRAPELDASIEHTPSDSGSLALALTRTGALMGTPAYMAPEQWAGARTDARSDQFSFCAALWEGLYGRRAFVGANLVELSNAVTSGDIQLPPDDADVPPWLRAVLLRGLAVDPDQRWPSMRALLDAIGSDPIARRRRIALWLASASVTLAVVAALGWLAARELRHNARRAYWNAITAELLEIERERSLSLAQDEARRSRDATRMSVLRSYDSPLVSRHEDPTVALALLREIEGELRGGSEWISKANELLGRPIAHAVLEGHREGVGPLLFSPDGAWIYSASDDGEVRRWNPHTGVGEHLLSHTKMVQDLALSHDGELLASASDDGTVRLWSAGDGRSRVLAQHERPVMAIEFDARGHLLASASMDGSVQIHALASGDVVQLDVGSPLLSLSFDSEAQRLLVGTDVGAAYVWQLASASAPEPRLLARLEGHTAPVFHAHMLSADRAVTGSDDGSARLWRLDQVPPTSVELARHPQAISSIAVHGSQIATGAVDGSIHIGSLEPPHDSRSLPGHTDMVWGLQFTPDGQHVVSGSFDRSARLTRVDGRGVPQVLVGHRQALFRVALDPTGRWLATGSYDSTIRVWDLTRPRLATPLVGHRDAISSLTLDATGRRALTSSHDGSARLWDTHDGTLLAQLDGEGPLQHAVFSPDGQYVATANDGGVITLWQPASGTQRKLVGHDRAVWRVAFDRSSTQLASACFDGTARIWSVVDDRPPLVLRGHEAGLRAVDFEPSGSRLITASNDGTLRAWAVDDGSMQQLVRAHDSTIVVLVRSPDGHTLATGSDDGTARLWTELGAAPIVLPGHGKVVWSIRFDAASRRVVTGSHDGRARVWSVDDGQLLATLGGEADAVWDAAFLGDDRIVTASSDGSVRIHALDSATPTVVLSDHGGQVFALALTPRPTRMVSAGTDGNMMLWQLAQLDTNGARLQARMREATSFCLSPMQRMRELGEAPEQASAAATACSAMFGRH